MGQKVQVSDRLVDSMAMLVQGEWGLSPMMQRYMKSQASTEDSVSAMGAMNQPILEINPEHSVIQRLKHLMEDAPDAPSTKDFVVIIYETAALSGGYSIEDPVAFARRVTALMEQTNDVTSFGG